MSETIFALSTVIGKSGVAVIRISGSLSSAIPNMLGYSGLLQHKKAAYARLYTLNKEDVLDDVILLYFKSPHSFNGEEILEIHSHGSIAVIQGILNELSQIPYMRQAEAGEFTKIAFKNGKMDLVKAEALADLLNAETCMQKKIAQQQLSGALSNIYHNWRQSLVQILSQLEALIDFPDDDIPEEALQAAEETVRLVSTQISAHIARNKNIRRIMDGIKIVISGSPNVGKSSLLNLLAQQDVAIVSDIPGTTRDLLQVKLDLEGFAVLLSDTAGLRETQDNIEKEGIRRAKSAIQEADINVVMINEPDEILQYSSVLCDQKVIWLFNKTDLFSKEEVEAMLAIMRQNLANRSNDIVIPISISKFHGIDFFIKALYSIIKDNYQESVLEPVSSRLRQSKGLERCLSCLNEFNLAKPLEIAAQDIRNASDQIGMLTGKICVEEVLDEVFANFCIGK